MEEKNKEKRKEYKINIFYKENGDSIEDVLQRAFMKYLKNKEYKL